MPIFFFFFLSRLGALNSHCVIVFLIQIKIVYGGCSDVCLGRRGITPCYGGVDGGI